MAVDGDNNFNFVWFRDGIVTAGSSDKLDRHRSIPTYELPDGYTPDDVVAIAADGNLNHVWYRDGRTSTGSTRNLAEYRLPRYFCADHVCYDECSKEGKKACIDTIWWHYCIKDSWGCLYWSHLTPCSYPEEFCKDGECRRWSGPIR